MADPIYPALTTKFTPPPECFTKWTVVSETTLVTGIIAQDIKPPRNSREASCYPPGVFSTLSYLYATFSPGICPSGYRSTVQTVNDGATTAICCMSGFTGTYGCTSSYTSSTTALLLTDLGNTGPAPTRYTTVGPGQIYAEPVYIIYQETDFSILTELRPTTSFLNLQTTGSVASSVLPSQSFLPATTETSAPTLVPNLNANDRSSSLTNGEKAVVIIGCVLAGLLVLAALRFCLSKYRKKRQGTTPTLNGTGTTSSDVRSLYPDWPVDPKRLGQTGFRAIMVGLFDGLMMVLPLLFVVLAGFAKHFDGKLVDENPRGRQVIVATQYGVTIYPILFAAVMGRVVEMTVGWLAERGGTVLILEQLFGSTTLFGTLKTQILLRASNSLMVLLIVLWSLSPLGGQGTLRLISVEDRSLTRANPFWSLDMNGRTGTSTIFYTPKAIGVQGTAVNSVFSTSLIAPDEVQNATFDLWGNVKIPRLESLDVLPDSNGWRAVPLLNVSYSSLVGIPIANIPKVGNSSFVVQSSYYEFSCPDDPLLLPASEEIIWFGNGTGKVRGSGQIVAGQGTFRDYGKSYGADFGTALEVTFSIATEPPSLNNLDSEALSPLPFYFQSAVKYRGDVDDTIAALNCTVSYPSVESKVQCQGSLCRVVAVRPATKYLVSPFFSFLNDATNSGVLLQAFVAASGPAVNYPFYGSTFIEVYLESNVTNPLSNPDRGGMADLTKVPGPVLGERLGRLFNSFWIPSLAPLQITGNIASAAEFENSTSSNNGVFPHNQTEGVVAVLEQIYVCHNEWLAVLLISALVLFICAVVGTLLKNLTKGPMIFGHVSSLTRDNPFTPLLSGASALDGFDRARLMKKTRIRLGDAYPHDPVGHVALMVVNDTTEDVVTLKKADPNRFYD